MADIFTIFTFQNGDFDVLLEDGGLFRLSTLPAAKREIGATTSGNYDLVLLGGDPLSVIGPDDGVPPDGALQLFAYAGGSFNCCKLEGGTETIVPNTIT